MSKGLDANVHCTNIATCLVNEGYAFVARYINQDKHEPLTHAEAIALSAHGLYLVSTWEKGEPITAGYFTHDKGKAHGREAYETALNIIKQPAHTPIYFAVDFDASEAELQGHIRAYFEGVRESFAELGSEYFVGVYGSGRTCRYLSELGFVSYTWKACPTDWGGADFDGWNIHQTRCSTKEHPLFVCGVDADTDETRGNGGGYQVS